MKHDTTMQDGIRAALNALARILDQAAKDAAQAHSYMQRNEQNLAIGTLLPAVDAVERAAALAKAVLAMHQFRE